MSKVPLRGAESLLRDDPVIPRPRRGRSSVNIVGWVVGDPDRSEDGWRVQFNPRGSTVFRELVEVASHRDPSGRGETGLMVSVVMCPPRGEAATGGNEANLYAVSALRSQSGA